MDDIQRRANPPGWTAPRAPYNPFDPDDKRPPEGYPSEFSTPSRVPGKLPTQYDQMRDTMRRLQYVPRPQSELYPGQYKVLRRVNNYTKFDKGAEVTAKLLMGGILIYGVFFHRWNDGQENIFSWAYRLRLQAQYLLTDALSPQQKEDLEFVKLPSSIRLGTGDGPETTVNEEFGLERPQRKHILEVERRKQIEEEELLSKR
ncbi:CYFA0S23e01068g1_1 [Cyberlindnera fabianii]|uniref:CYFA0S23e01068g1_1 n=1 Tax=Cyberlindnera fabianii TaxID=36022 RepID=A0A061BAQ3_CYBFA|nr:hypothetical protein BON22_4274 [Cyberlindnera fabianii]CDR46444.1 CYFA0S23e01068g1_1 [Cyberlindnera fabianii]